MCDQLAPPSISSDLPEKPAPLPPDPPLDMTRLYPLLDKANTALGRLDGMSMVLPDPELFLYMYVRKEAVLSSQIEGTQSSLLDLLLFEFDEAPGAPIDDVTEGFLLRVRSHLRHGAPQDLAPLSAIVERDACAIDEQCARRRQTTRRISNVPELDRRNKARNRAFCTSAN